MSRPDAGTDRLEGGMRQVGDPAQFTPFGLWIREYLRQDMSITNLDYLIEDYKFKRLQMLEEKQSGGRLHHAQRLTFQVLDQIIGEAAKTYDYWGFFVLQFASGKTFPGPGMTLNDRPINCEQLQAHLNFEHKFCEPYAFAWRQRLIA